ncbi:MAG: VCBS repeat-containing protein [Planctomycetia bacterium]|nr:VCBS repeat-containing protein [Planctomycetia bacterium]
MRANHSVRGRRLGAAMCCVGLIGVLAGCGGPTPAPAARADDLLALENEGLSHLERYEEKETLAAVELLGRVVERAPTWRDARVNYALALAASRRADLLVRAVEEYARVLADDPTNPHALLGTALVLRFQGRLEEGLPYLRRLLEVDPDEPSVYTWLGAFELERVEEDHAAAEGYLRRALALAPDDTVAMAALGTVLQRSGRGEGDEAKALLAKVRALTDAEGFGTPALTKHRRRGDKEYGESGRYGQAIRDLAPPAGAGLGLAGDVGLAAVVRDARPAIACGDADGDGDDDLWVGGPTTPGHLYRNDGGRFTDVTDAAGLGATTPATAALFADLDDDGRLDLVLSGDGVVVYRGGEGGRFAPDPAGPLATGDGCGALCAADLDHDGDVDLLVAGARLRFLRNRRDGRFEDVTDARGLACDAPRAAFAADLDDDGILDVVAVDGHDRLRGWRNGRLDPFVEDPRTTALGPCVGATAADLDADGALDLVLVRPDGAVALARGSGRGAFALVPDVPTRRVGARAVAATDVDGDGRLDLVAFGAAATVFRAARGGRFAVEPLALPAGDRDALALLDADGDGDVDAVLAGRGAPPAYLRNAAPVAGHALRLRLRGVPDRVEGRTWTNARGLGADVEVKAGDLLARRAVQAGAGFPGQASDVLVVGLGGAARADFVRVRWPDGVLQSEHEVPTGRLHEIVEVNRKIASCPVIFAWDGETFRYVADCLGSGGLGFYAGPPLGYAPPDPTEVIRLPALAPRDGRFVVQLLENLEEVSYLDEARLLVVDHPADLEVFPDERFAVAEPMPTDRLHAVATRVFPRRAVDERGRDVLARLLADDRATVDGFEKDPRFLGLARPHHVELDFGDALPALAPGERLVMCLSGWIEYGYSKTVYAAQQAGITQAPPTLEVEVGGAWRPVATLGYPAGTPRTMTYDVTGLLGPTRGRCRIATNLEVYWDRVFVAKDVAGDRLRVTTLPVAAADLHAKGYPREFSPDGKAPTLYDYSVCEAWIPFRTLPGDHTKFGDVTPLLGAADDRFVIFGKGEEVTLAFDAATLPPLPAGHARTFLLRVDGYCKDRDPYTGAGDAVEPLPFHGMSTYPYPATERYPTDPLHTEYRARWNTRRIR